MQNTDKQPQTIGEWLDWAEKQGYEWAKEAREETVRLSGERRLDGFAGTLFHAVYRMFGWHESIKGIDHWDEVAKSVEFLHV